MVLELLDPSLELDLDLDQQDYADFVGSSVDDDGVWQLNHEHLVTPVTLSS